MIDRCGVITGPWQMGKVDQGVFAFWLFHHHFGLPLSYIGYGGAGKQVRDLLHIDDLVELVDEQLGDPEGWAGFVGNVGGGRDNSLSLLETTEICRELTGNEVPIERVPETRRDDVPIFIADCARLFERDRLAPAAGTRAGRSPTSTAGPPSNESEPGRGARARRGGEGELRCRSRSSPARAGWSAPTRCAAWSRAAGR